MLAIPALLGEHVIGPYEGQPKPPLEVVVVTLLAKDGIFSRMWKNYQTSVQWKVTKEVQ